MKRKPFVWLGLVVLALSLVAGTFYVAAYGSASAVTETPPEATSTQLALVRRGDLSLTISGVGSLVAAETVDLSFADLSSDSGDLVELLVKPGDAVQAGDVLARLQVNKSENELAAEVTSAQVVVLQAQHSLDEIHANADFQAAQALLALEQARDAVDDLLDTALEESLARQAVAEAGLELEEYEFQQAIVHSTPSDEAVYIAYASLMFKEKELAELEKQQLNLENQIKSAPDKLSRERLKNQLARLKIQILDQQIAVDNARYKYEHMDDEADAIAAKVVAAQITTAEAALAQAEQALLEVQAGPTAGALAQAEVQLSQAQDEWARWQHGPDPQALALAEAELAAAQARLAIAQAEQLVLELVAPQDGTVLTLSAEVGDRITAQDQTILTLADLSRPLLDIYLDETDLLNVKVGSQANVIFDAFPDQTFNGSITAVDPGLQTSGNVNAVLARVELEAAPILAGGVLPVGLNAAVDVIAAQVENAFLVPVEALHLEADEYVVYVQMDGGLERRVVTVAVQDYTTAGVTSGLAEGETVVLGEVSIEEGEL